MAAATGSVDGYLTSTDWNTFNNKSNTTGTVTSVSGTGTVNGISLSGTVTSSGNLTLGGTLSNVSLSTQVTGTLPIANGGTGETTRQAAMDALAGAVTSGQYLRGNGTDVVMSAIQAADVPTLNQNTTGTAANVTGTVAIANGGTGQTTANAAYNALSPMTTTGDITYEATGGIATRLPIGTAGQVLTVTSGIPAWATAGGGGGLSWQSVQTSSFTATSNRGYPVNTTSAPITATLPASPTAGDILTFVDYAGTWQTNLFVIAPNGQNFLGTTGSRTLNQTREGISIVYVDSTQGWLPFSGFNAITPIGEISVEYLAVAGGGGGGGEYGAAGGGAGGLLTSTITNITLGTSYTVTVGAGGAGSSSGSNKGSTGSNSVFSSVTASGGGGGGSYLTTAGANGGSGGGGTTNAAGGTGTSGQGNAGGTGSTISSAPNGAGGGGASAAGGSSVLNGAAGAGGAGSASSITGTSVTRAGGGGGANDARFGSSVGAGGAGGGGAGSLTNGVAGTANTGGGGGGAGNLSNIGGAGGSGVVILKYADSFTVANSGGGLTFSTASAGGFKVTTFTAGTGNITFN
jgi:hypothetical protein